MDLGAAVRVHGKEADPAGRYTTDLFLIADRFEACDPFRPALRVLSFDIENSITDGHIFCIGIAYREAGEIKTLVLQGSEREIVDGFIKLVHELDPDIISGYNIDGYDLPVLIDRAAKNGIPRLQLARDFSDFFHLGERFWRVDGRILTDVWWAVRAERLSLHMKQETLDYVGRQLLGEGKHELSRRHIDEEWAKDREKVIRYCLNDADLSLRILEKIGRIEKTLDLAAVSKLPLEDVLHGRTKMREATDPEMREFYDGLQAAIKVLMNAFYGVLASSFYRFNDPKVGASITAFARERIKGIIAELEADGVKVVYADTDSVFFQSPTAGLEPSLEFARKTAERFSRGRISMEVDKVYRSLFSHGRKKRYAGKVAWPTEGEIVVRGYEIRRTDAFDLQSEAQLLVFDKILDNDPDGAIDLAKRIVAEVRDGNPPLANPDKDPIEMLVISRTVKEENQYVNPDSMSNVIAARKLEQMGEEFMPGMKVSWIVTDHKKSPMEVEPYLSGAKFEKMPDWEYYARRVAQTLAYVTEVYGWDEKALLTGKRSQQKSLSSDDFNEALPAESPRRADKKLTLEDFF